MDYCGAVDLREVCGVCTWASLLVVAVSRSRNLLHKDFLSQSMGGHLFSKKIWNHNFFCVIGRTVNVFDVEAFVSTELIVSRQTLKTPVTS